MAWGTPRACEPAAIPYGLPGSRRCSMHSGEAATGPATAHQGSARQMLGVERVAGGGRPRTARPRGAGDREQRSDVGGWAGDRSHFAIGLDFAIVLGLADAAGTVRRTGWRAARSTVLVPLGGRPGAG